MRKIETNQEIYNVIFEIDKFKRAYLRCRLRNAHIQINQGIPKVIRKNFARKSKILAALIKRIIKREYRNHEEFFLLTQTCAIIESEIPLLFNKIDIIRDDDTFKNFYLESEFLIETFVGKSTGVLFIQNHPFITLLIFFIVFALATFFIPTQDSKIIFYAVFLLMFLVFAYFANKNWDKIVSVVRANRIKNKYTFLNKPGTENINDTILSILKANAKIK